MHSMAAETPSSPQRRKEYPLDPISVETGIAIRRIRQLLTPTENQIVQADISRAVFNILAEEFRKIKRRPTLTVNREEKEQTIRLSSQGLRVGPHTMVIKNRPLTLPLYFLLTPNPSLVMCQEEAVGGKTQLTVAAEGVFEGENPAKKQDLAIKTLIVISRERRRQRELFRSPMRPRLS